jgi:hypothetical protein
MMKFSCTMVAGGEDFFYVTLIAENAKAAREMAASETRRGTPRDWNAAVLEREIEGPARVLASGSREAKERGHGTRPAAGAGAAGLRRAA